MNRSGLIRKNHEKRFVSLGSAKSRNVAQRRGVTYLLVLGTTLLVAVMGLGGLLAARTQSRTANLLRNASSASDLALSAIAIGRLKINEDQNWRTTYASGGWSVEQQLGDGYSSWKVVDASTGGSVLHAGINPLADTATVKVCGKGRVGKVIHNTVVELSVTKNPYGALKSALYAAGNVTLNSSNPLTVSGAPFSTAGVFNNSITFTGDVEAQSITNTGTLTGKQTTGAAPKTTPPNSVWDIYRPLATQIPWDSAHINAIGTTKTNFKTNVLSPGVTNFSPPMSSIDGVYWVEIPATATGILQIDWMRINGTVLFDVKAANFKVHFGAHIIWTPARADYPMAIIRNAQTVDLDSLTALMAEGSNLNGAGNANYNPTGFPYSGVSNTNTTDANYVSKLWGVIHVMGSSGGTPTVTNLFPQCHTVGCVIAPGAVTYTGGGATPDASLTWDATYLTDPPLGYYTLQMTPISGSWRQELTP